MTAVASVGKSYSGIAQAMGCSKSSEQVKVHYKRNFKRLRLDDVGRAANTDRKAQKVLEVVRIQRKPVSRVVHVGAGEGEGVQRKRKRKQSENEGGRKFVIRRGEKNATQMNDDEDNEDEEGSPESKRRRVFSFKDEAQGGGAAVPTGDEESQEEEVLVVRVKRSSEGGFSVLFAGVK
jgi:hypothetical protein